jgi:hypothetical protein
MSTKNYWNLWNTFHSSLTLQGRRFFEKHSENAFFPWKWLNKKTNASNGTIRKCSSRAFQSMVTSVGVDNLKFWGQFLCPPIGGRSYHQSLRSTVCHSRGRLCHALTIWHCFIHVCRAFVLPTPQPNGLGQLELHWSPLKHTGLQLEHPRLPLVSLASTSQWHSSVWII